jgi:hypothetical protein
MFAYLEKAHDISHILLEPKINHAVGFVHAKVPAIVERKPLFFQHIYQTSWRRHNDMQTLVQCSALLAHGDASDTENAVELGIFAALRKSSTPAYDIVVRLASQLARRAEDDPHRAFALYEGHLSLFLKGHHDQRHAEGEGLA